ncbi:uncharacterized protein F44E2.8-like [Hydractinia symbiolongicarpus]|uniref:uncharacterized protein F44E2.8-like n=1 Tax=Hydractinia symbiolongicarpus TaxID=13093 RepID=UPI00254FEBDF|nr:uncharacterized protein F44E2.8-like [Hydractinia symbiolongicarpus]
MESKKVVLFYGSDDIYSQFYPCSFTVDGVRYNCCEQYMMHQKALLFKDQEMASKIMKETNPRIIKSYGRKVKNFDDEVWTENCRDVVYKGNLAKFSQNENLKSKLLLTGTKLIAEASPTDRRWGIGLSKSNSKSHKPKEWRGKNWLGGAIMKVRSELVDTS